MEIEPLYCAEQVQGPTCLLSKHRVFAVKLFPAVSQIKVPPNLADVLKAYTKEVIRQQPADILEFSAKWVLTALMCRIRGLLVCTTSLYAKEHAKGVQLPAGILHTYLKPLTWPVTSSLLRSVR